MAKSKMQWYDWILSLLVAVALINLVLVAWFNFNLIEVIFRIGWLIKTIYTIVAVLGLIGLITLITKLLLR